MGEKTKRPSLFVSSCISNSCHYFVVFSVSQIKEHPWAPGNFPYQLNTSATSMHNSWRLLLQILVSRAVFVSLFNPGGYFHSPVPVSLTVSLAMTHPFCFPHFLLHVQPWVKIDFIFPLCVCGRFLNTYHLKTQHIGVLALLDCSFLLCQHEVQCRACTKSTPSISKTQGHCALMQNLQDRSSHS